MAGDRSATLYRMVLPDHTCPHGVRAKALLEKQGYAVDDRLLKTREEVDAFEQAQEVATPPWSSSVRSGSAVATTWSAIWPAAEGRRLRLSGDRGGRRLRW